MTESYIVTDNEVFVCAKCGSLVGDTTIHNQWHSGLLEGYEPSQIKLFDRWMSVKSPEQLAKERKQ